MAEFKVSEEDIERKTKEVLEYEVQMIQSKIDNKKIELDSQLFAFMDELKFQEKLNELKKLDNNLKIKTAERNFNVVSKQLTTYTKQ
jgi:hypothetical protein